MVWHPHICPTQQISSYMAARLVIFLACLAEKSDPDCRGHRLRGVQSLKAGSNTSTSADSSSFTGGFNNFAGHVQQMKACHLFEEASLFPPNDLLHLLPSQEVPREDHLFHPTEEPSIIFHHIPSILGCLCSFNFASSSRSQRVSVYPGTIRPLISSQSR